MFTGIVEEKGTIQAIHQTSEAAMEMIIRAKTILEDIKMGDSISVSGVCLTVTDFTATSFSVDVMPETMKHTSLAELASGCVVNLERAMRMSDRLGGHFVSGHVDGTGVIVQKQRNENAIEYQIEVPGHLTPYFMEKGSVTLDGISLTVFSVQKNKITVSIIPHTAGITSFGEKEAGNVVNVECDLLLRHIHHLISQDVAFDGHQLTIH